jgi:hypothetical protein
MNPLLNAKELKERGSLVDLLTRLGYQPARKSSMEYHYISMLRDNDTKPSLSVNDQLGVWFDHGTGKGGNIIDFGLAYWSQLPFSEVVEKIQEICSGTISSRSMRPRTPIKIPHYIIEELKNIGTHPAITEYLKSRGVFEHAKTSMKEVYYYVQDYKGERKHFFAAGWKNENGSWEVRNKYFKGCLGRKGITFVPGDQKRVVVFEGYLNYLSWLAEKPAATESGIILNSLSLLNAGIGKAKLFSSIDLFFDRDQPGYQASKEFIKTLPYATDRSSAYDGFNDYNDMLTSCAQGIFYSR